MRHRYPRDEIWGWGVDVASLLGAALEPVLGGEQRLGDGVIDNDRGSCAIVQSCFVHGGTARSGSPRQPDMRGMS